MPAIEEHHACPFELARPWDVLPEVSPIINLSHTAKSDTIAAAMSAVECELDMVVR